VVPLALAFSWRVALMAAGTLAFVVLAVLLFNRQRLTVPAIATPAARARAAAPGEGSLDFLRIPAVWMCFGFFFFYAFVLSLVQAFAPESARQLHNVPMAAAAMCLTAYMICSAGGMALGGFLAADPARCEKVVGLGFGVAALVALLVALAPVPGLAVPALFGIMGLSTGLAAPSRDLLVKRSTPENATGRVYGVVYSGLDIGQAISPLIFGVLMDHQQYRAIWLGLVLLQAVLITSAFNVGRVRRTVLAAA